MARMGGVNYNDLKRFQQELSKLQSPEEFLQECTKELAARLLAKAIERTPVGDYSKQIIVTTKRNGKKHKKGEQYTKRVNPSGKQGGTLRRGWVTKTHEEAEQGSRKRPDTKEISAFVEALRIERIGGQFKVELTNPVEYAPYVEYGHRTSNHKKWVLGKFMMTMAADEIQQASPSILERKIRKYLERCIK